MDINPDIITRVEGALEQWKDHRIAHADDIRDLLFLHVYGQAIFAKLGLGLTGWVLRHNGDTCLLTVKLFDAGTPLVVFVTSRTPTGCISQLFDLMERDKLTFQRDKYPWV